jgi:uncharacterized integral membrane protein (TIGR00697 family)
MNLFYKLSLLMGLVVVFSNYLVQFPVQFFGLNEILTYGAFSYPVTFLITDLANRAYGKLVARKLVYVGFTIGVLLTLFVSTNFSDIISIRVAIGSGVAFFIAQNLDVQIFDFLRKKIWFVAPLVSSNIPWVSLAFGDLVVKLLIALVMLIPFRMLINKIKDFSDSSASEIKISE